MRPLLPRLCLFTLTIAGMPLGAAQELPTRVPGEVVDAEPRLMLDDLPNLSPGPDGDAIPPVSVERARVELERARSKQQRWQKLARAGVLSQVEAESTALQVARALVKYQAALAEQAAAQVAQLRARRARGEIPAEELAAAEATHQTSAALATAAAAHLQLQQRRSAEANLDRQRRLYALGITSRSQVQRAQSAVEKLQTDPVPLPRGL
jgi:multidrug resistance efflux pump